MEKPDKNISEYQTYLHSLFKKYGIESLNEVLTEKEWKIKVDSQLDSKQKNLFYKDLVKFEVSLKNKNEENKSNDKLDSSNDVFDWIKSDDSNQIRLKTCPSCAEEIKYAAHKCRFCGEIQNTSKVRGQNRNSRNIHLLKALFWIVVSGFLLFSFLEQMGQL